MLMETLLEYAKEIKADDSKTYKLTPRELIAAFGWERRSANCQFYVNKFLSENYLEVDPNYVEVWIDYEITLKHKKKASAKINNPIKNIGILEAANNAPVTIKNDSMLSEAISVMMINNFSQLPVTTGGVNIVGYISWETIGTALANGVKSDIVKTFVDSNIRILKLDTPLLEAIRIIYDSGFAVIQAQDKKLCGIVTTADISSQFLTMTEPFLLLEHIENHIRRLLANKILVDELNKLCIRDNKKILTSIDDLNFGEYIRLIENEEIWNRLGISLDRVYFINKLNDIRGIRNDVMHFDPDGISAQHLTELRNMAKLLVTLSNY